MSYTSRAIKRLFEVAKPSIITRGPRKELTATSYLDGLRGFAAFLVYWQHHQVWARVANSDAVIKIYSNAYGFDGNYYFACLPFFRTFFSGGHFAVAVFFVISGHVLSAKPMSYIHTKNFTKFEDNVSSALFRRWMRLYLPIIGTTFVYMTSWHLFGIWTPYPDHQTTYVAEVGAWIQALRPFSYWLGPNASGGKPQYKNIFGGVDNSEKWFPYNFHLWTIPVEFRGTMIIFVTLIALSRATQTARLWLQVGFIYYFVAWIEDTGCFYAMFLAGMFLGDLQQLAQRKKLPNFIERLAPHKKAIYYYLFGISLYLSGVPSFNEDVQDLRKSPGWFLLSFFQIYATHDYKWFYLLIAAVFLVASVPRIPWLKRFFETRFNQYLGNISYSFYLVHGPVLWTLGDRVYAAVGWPRGEKADMIKAWANLLPLPQTGPLGLEPAFLLPHLLLLPVTFWVAEIATKVFDQPSVTFSRWFYRKTLGS